jgi:hypothetical protein
MAVPDMTLSDYSQNGKYARYVPVLGMLQCLIAELCQMAKVLAVGTLLHM